MRIFFLMLLAGVVIGAPVHRVPDRLYVVEPWTPADITTELWFDAADTNTITFSPDFDGGFISQWNDKSGNDLHVTPQVASADFGPRYNNQTVQFTSDGRHLGRTGINNNVLMPLGRNRADFIAVMSYYSGTVWFWVENPGVLTTRIIGQTARRGSFQDSAYAWSTNYTLSAAKSIVNLNKSETVFSVYVNGNFAGSKANSLTINSATVVLYLGSYLNATLGSVVDYNEIVFGQFSEDDRQKIEGYLAHKWGLEANLPDDHPYKESAP